MLLFPQGGVDEVGWGTRTGGVIVSGRPSLVCDVEFKANPLKRSQEVKDGGSDVVLWFLL